MTSKKYEYNLKCSSNEAEAKSKDLHTNLTCHHSTKTTFTHQLIYVELTSIWNILFTIQYFSITTTHHYL
jgi:hypothetical protein